MPESEKLKSQGITFSLVGAGRLGSLVTLELFYRGVKPVQIINRSLPRARELAQRTGCILISQSIIIDGNPDFILVAVNDDSIPGVIAFLEPTDIPVFHCSGSTAMCIFPQGIPNHGVLYPLQSFSSERKVSFKDIPILIEASNIKSYALLEKISGLLSQRIIPADSELRMKSHIAAVFASNFSYHFIAIARNYLKENGLPVDLLTPLLQESFLKAIEHPDLNLQTGPAVREDKRILQMHIDVLKNEPSLQKLYTFVTDSIIQLKIAKEKE